jgi:hypothetical protein
MEEFPRTMVGGISLPRMIIGSNWFLGWSHCTAAKDAFIKEHFGDYKKVADIIEVFLRNGVNAVMGLINSPILPHAVKEAEDRTGVECIIISTPGYPVDATTPTEGFDMDAVRRILDADAEHGAAFSMPHTSTTDALVCQCTRRIRQIEQITTETRARGMVPGLSTHMPEAIIYADESGADVETYISLFNSMGFLMHLEVDWTQRIIHAAKKPVITIKPFAAGQVRPLQGLTFSWNALRDEDMVTVGTMTPGEAQELCDMSRQILSRRAPEGALQRTRSKASVES